MLSYKSKHYFRTKMCQSQFTQICLKTRYIFKLMNKPKKEIKIFIV